MIVYGSWMPVPVQSWEWISWLCRWYDGNTGVFAQTGPPAFIPNRADEILKVLNIKENRSHYAVRCQVRHPDTHVTRCTYLLIKGDPDEDMLLRELERRKTWENALEPAGNWNLLYILLGGLALAACVTMCVLSHPGCCRDVR